MLMQSVIIYTLLLTINSYIIQHNVLSHSHLIK